MNCPVCRQDSYTYSELATGGMIDHCGNCHSELPKDHPAEKPALASRPVALTVVAQPASGIAKIVADAKARLAEIEIRIADIEAIKAEAETLRAMIRAAEGSMLSVAPRAVA
jgi:hypothetical protein